MGLTAVRVESVKSGKRPCREDSLDKQGDDAFDMATELHIAGFNKVPVRTSGVTLLGRVLQQRWYSVLVRKRTLAFYYMA